MAKTPAHPLSRAGSQTVTSRLPTDTVQRIDAAAASAGASRNEIVNAALALGLEDFEASDAANIPNPEGRARFIASRLARKQSRKASGGKPAPSPSGKPAPSPGTKPPGQRASAAPATRSAAPAKVLVSWKEYDALLALRAKRAGTPAPPKGASGACATVWVHATDAELAAVRGSK